MKLTMLQKEILIWVVFLLICAGAGAFYIEHTPNAHPGMIRLHVIANSDSPEDQRLKLQVRNEIIEFMDGQQSLSASRKYIDEHLSDIETLSEDVIKIHGFAYGAKVERKVTFIPAKSYEDLTLPAGNYETLNVTLGRGKGQNWWCVIYPRLCLIGKTGKDNPEGKIVLKSKIAEMIKNTEARNK